MSDETFRFLERELEQYRQRRGSMEPDGERRILLPHELRNEQGPVIIRAGGPLPENRMDKAERTGFFKGRVEVKGVIEEPGERPRVAFHHADNTITFDARTVMAYALSGVADAFITVVAWGADGRQPQRGDTDLYDPRITSAVTQVSYPTPESVVFSSTLPPGIGTGLQLQEVGLKSTGGATLLQKLFARFVFPQQEKFDRLRLSVNWQIIFI